MADQIRLPGAFITGNRLRVSPMQEGSDFSCREKETDMVSPYSQAPARMYSVTEIPGADLLNMQSNQWSQSAHSIDISTAAGMVFGGKEVTGTIEKYPTGGEVRTAPCRGPDGTIYVGCCDGTLYAYKNGRNIWGFETERTITSSPCVDTDNIVYFGGFDHKIHAVQDNKEIWSFTTGGEVRSSPLLGPDGTLYVGSDDGTLYALKNGEPVWAAKAGGAIRGRPALGKDGTVYTATQGGRIIAFDGNTGQQKWDYTPYGYDKFSSGPLVGPDDTVYIGGEKGKFYAIKEGEEKWVFTPEVNMWGDTSFKDPINSTAVMDEEGVIYFGCDNKRLYALRDQGEEAQKLWEFETLGNIYDSPVIADDGTIYISSYDARVYAVKDGRELNHYEAHDWVMGSPCVCPNGMVYFGSNDRHIYGVKGAHKPSVSEKSDSRENSGTGSSSVQIDEDMLTIQGVRLPINKTLRHSLGARYPVRRKSRSDFTDKQ